MSEEKETKGVPLLYPTEKVAENWWNMNAMGTEEYHALKEDMRAKGPFGIDPILVMRGTNVEFVAGPEGLIGKVEKGPYDYLAVDGCHRLRAAKELKWPQIRLVIAEDIKDEATARNISYSKNYERGRIDPWKEAQNFQWLKEQGWTGDRIAKEYHIDKSQVSKRLSLLDVDPGVKKELEKLPHVKVTASHFEPIATLKPELQKVAAKEIERQAGYSDVRQEGTISTKRVEQIARDVKQEDAKRKELEGQVAKYKFKKCPKCRKPPHVKDHKGFPWVMCENYHSWNLKTGMTEQEELLSKYPKVSEVMGKAKPVKAPFPNYLRTTYTLKQFSKMFSSFAVDMLGSLESVKEVSVSGTDSLGKAVEIKYDLSQMGVHLRYNEKNLYVEEKSYESEKLKDFKTVVTTFPEINNKAKAKETSQLVAGMMDQYGEKVKVKTGNVHKRGKRTKRSKRSKRGK